MTERSDLQKTNFFLMLITLLILWWIRNTFLRDDVFQERKKRSHQGPSVKDKALSRLISRKKKRMTIHLSLKTKPKSKLSESFYWKVIASYYSHLLQFRIPPGTHIIVCPTTPDPEDEFDFTNQVIDVSLRSRGQSGQYFSGLSESHSFRSLIYSRTSSGYNSLTIYDDSSLAISGRQSDNPVLAAPRSLGSSGFGSGVVQETSSFPVSRRITPDFENYDFGDENDGLQNPPQNENPLSCLEQIQREERRENFDNESIYGAVGGMPLDQPQPPVVHSIPRSLVEEDYSRRDTVMLNQNLEATQIKEPVSDRLVPSKEEPANSSSNCQAPLPTQKENRGIRSEDIQNQPFHDDNVDQSHGNRFGSFNQLHIDQRSSESSVEVVDDITQAPETENLESGLAETQGAVVAENLEIQDAILAAIHDDYLFGESQLRGGGEHESVEDCNGGEGITDQRE